MSNETVKDYWRDCISEAAEECGASLTLEQIEAIADAVQVSHDQYGMAFGVPPACAHEQTRARELERLLADERNKSTCPACRGSGLVPTDSFHDKWQSCPKCGGEGRCSR